jgi:WD40 repeat protein
MCVHLWTLNSENVYPKKGTFYIWDWLPDASILNLKLNSVKKFTKHHSKFVFFLQFSLNEDYLFSGGKDKKLKILDLETMNVKYEFNFIDSVFFSIELHSPHKSQLFISGKNNKLTRKFCLQEDMQKDLTSNNFIS